MTQAVLFWLFAITAVVGSIFVITRRNLIAAVMGMVGTFFAVAALYAMLFAHFMAAIQVLVYAGAIMVLFVFVVMVLNAPEDEPLALHGLVGKVIAAIALLYVTYRLGAVLWDVRESGGGELAAPAAEFGSTRAMGKTLFSEYLFPFEAVSIVLLAAVVGAVAIAQPNRPKTSAEGAGEAEAK